MIKANDPALKSWVPIPLNSDFPIQNLPFGIIKTSHSAARMAVAIGGYALDMAAAAELGYFSTCNVNFKVATLNDFIAQGKPTWQKVREAVSELLRADNPALRDQAAHRNKVLLDQKAIQLLMPVHVGDYTDFYSSIDHATNIGTMIRDPSNALMPNWKHLPVAYHGRASSITISNTNFHRPRGQSKPADAELPVFGPTKLLDFELETAFIIGRGNELGQSISTARAADHIFGMVLFNDWSARDIQTWEYVPLGPFLAKNFVSTISPWVVTLDALEPFHVPGYKQEPKVLPYLEYEGNKNIDINLEVSIQPENAIETKVCESNYKYMYWTMEQQLAHHTVNGCNMRVGDMLASGTISGPTPQSFGSMMEITWRGTKPITLADGTERKFINDGDTVILRGYSEKNGVRIGFGECRAKVLPALI